jgi:hypothetical protein
MSVANDDHTTPEAASVDASRASGPRVRRVGSLAFLAALWLLFAGAGLAVVWNYANRPGEPGTPPSRWPAETAIARAPGLPRLLLFVHPRCPCSRATLGELSLLLSRCRDRATCEVVFVLPPGVTADWERTDLVAAAKAIPGVDVRFDREGREAQRFGAKTSGETLLYDGAGRLRFHGGITAARGDSGDNLGRCSLSALLTDGVSALAETPVFGCSLLDPADCPAGDSPTCRR